MVLFAKKANCAACHAGANFTDEQYHNLGVGMDAEEPDFGRFAVTKADKDRGAFKTTTLRNVVFSAPYMHDGHYPTMKALIEEGKHGAKGGDIESLSKQELDDLVEFVLSL